MVADFKHAFAMVCEEWSHFYKSPLLVLMIVFMAVGGITIHLAFQGAMFTLATDLLPLRAPIGLEEAVIIFGLLVFSGIVAGSHEVVHLVAYAAFGVKGASLAWKFPMWKCVTPPGMRVPTNATIVALVAPMSISVICTIACFIPIDIVRFATGVALIVNALSSNWDSAFASYAYRSRSTIRSWEDAKNPDLLIGHP